jgi:hypothetical protein
VTIANRVMSKEDRQLLMMRLRRVHRLANETVSAVRSLGRSVEEVGMFEGAALDAMIVAARAVDGLAGVADRIEAVEAAIAPLAGAGTALGKATTAVAIDEAFTDLVAITAETRRDIEEMRSREEYQ